MNNEVYSFDKIKEITKPIFEKYEIKNAYLFGSYARGEAKNNSDIDIMIVRENSKIQTLLDLSEFEAELEKALDKEVDVITEETYLEEIESENKYGKLAKKMFYEQVIKDRRKLIDQF